MKQVYVPLTRTAALSVLLALVSNLAASRRGNEHVVTLDFDVVEVIVVFVCVRSVRSLQIKHAWKLGGKMRDSRNLFLE